MSSDKVASNLLSIFSEEELKAWASDNRFLQYQKDPVKFGEKELGESYTDEVKELMSSVMNHQITIAMSATAVGKSHSAATLALWAYKCFPDSKVYTLASPPENNLRTVLWGEINRKVCKRPQLFKNDKINDLRISKNKWNFIEGITIPTSGSEQDRESKVCCDADDLFELLNGDVVTFGSLIGKELDVISVNKDFVREKTKALFIDNGFDDVYEVLLETGQKIIRTGNHPLFSGRLRQSKKKTDGHIPGRFLVDDEKWMNCSDIKTGDLLLSPKDTSFNFGDLEMDEDEVKILAYLIGDGCVTRTPVLFIQENNKQLDEFKDCVLRLGATIKVFNPNEYSWKINGDGSGKWHSNPVLNLLKKHDVFGKNSEAKSIPKSIFLADKKSVSLFLNRLYSTDGWACINKTRNNHLKSEIGYSSKSETLVRDIQRLLLRFGIMARLCKRVSTWTHKGVKKSGVYWSCYISKKEDVLKFDEEIGIYGKEDALKICVDTAKTKGGWFFWRDSKYDGFKWLKVKSVKLIGRKQTVGVIVPGNNTYLTSLVEHNSGKHSAYLFFILDEGDAIPDEIYRGIDGCMSGENNRLLIMFNPKKEQGAAYRYIQTGRANVVSLSAFSHPNVISGYDVIPGAVSRAKTLERINEQTEALREGEEPNSECFEVPEFLVGTTTKNGKGIDYPPLKAGYRKIREQEFYYKVLGRYPAKGEDQLISRDWVDAARNRWDLYVAQFGEKPPEGIRPVIGLDVADMGEDENCLIARYGGYVEMPEKWHGVDPGETSEYAADIARDKKSLVVNVDSIGVGADVAPNIRRQKVKAARIMTSEKPTERPKKKKALFRKLRDQLWWDIRDWLENDNTAMLPPSNTLIEELLVATYEEREGKIVIMSKEKMKKLLRRSPNEADALCLTFAPKPQPPQVRLIG